MSVSKAPRLFSSFLLSLGFSVLATEKVGGGGAAGGGGGGGGIFIAGGQRETEMEACYEEDRKQVQTDLYEHSFSRETFSHYMNQRERLEVQ